MGFVVIAIYTALAYKQWRTADNTLQVANRAYVVVSEIELNLTDVQPQDQTTGLQSERVIGTPRKVGRNLQTGDFPVIEATIRNTGITPAQNLTTEAGVGLSPVVPTEHNFTVNVSGLVNETKVLGKDLTTSVTRYLNHPLTGPEADSLKPIHANRRPEQYLVFMAFVHYTDFFGHRWTTKVCSYWDWEQTTMSTCPGWNGITEEQ